MASPLSTPQRLDGRTSPAVRYLDTTVAYDLWSEVYDSDGNFLQALDTVEMKTLLPRFLSNITENRPWTLVDLGCGTGRNTAALLQVPDIGVVVGLDASPKMLEMAKSRLMEITASGTGVGQLHLEVYDMLANHQIPAEARGADAVVSTLVLEHVPIAAFFDTASRMLKTNGMLLVTNMHSEMGGISQAGFVDPRTGEKIRPKSYAHRVDEILAEAQRQGFEIVGEVLEKSVDANMGQNLGDRARKWIGVTVWFGMMLRRAP